MISSSLISATMIETPAMQYKYKESQIKNTNQHLGRWWSSCPLNLNHSWVWGAIHTDSTDTLHNQLHIPSKAIHACMKQIQLIALKCLTMLMLNKQCLGNHQSPILTPPPSNTKIALVPKHPDPGGSMHPPFPQKRPPLTGGKRACPIA